MNSNISNPPGSQGPAKILADRRHAARALQENATPPVVPLANPPTTMAEVPPGVAPIRAMPAPKQGVVESTLAPKDSVGEETIDPKNPAMVEGEAVPGEASAEEKETKSDEKRAALA